MQESGLKKLKKAFAIILLVLTVFSIGLSLIEANHKCSGEDCNICYVIQLAKDNLKLLKTAAGFVFTLSFISEKIKNFSVKNQFFFSNQNSLIHNKIRLND